MGEFNIKTITLSYSIILHKSKKGISTEIHTLNNGEIIKIELLSDLSVGVKKYAKKINKNYCTIEQIKQSLEENLKNSKYRISDNLQSYIFDYIKTIKGDYYNFEVLVYYNGCLFLSLFEKNKTFILKTKITFSIMNGLSYNNEYYEIFKLNDSTYSKSIKDKKNALDALKN